MGVPDRKCGFVTFGSRESAESAMNSLFDSLYLNQSKCQLNWAKSKEEDVEEEEKKKNEDGISKEEEQYLKKKGIVPPTLPVMPDPCVSSSTAYIGKSSTQYKSMSAHYKEAKVSTK